MNLAIHVLSSGLRSPSTIACCLVTWGVAFAIPPALPDSIGVSPVTSSQVISTTYFLTVIVTATALHSALGRRGRILRLLRYTPASALRFLGECVAAVTALGLLLAAGAVVASQVAPWHRLPSSSSILPALLCFGTCVCWMGLSTLALHFWLEPELCLPLALGVLLLVMSHPGSLPWLPDPWWPQAALAGELNLADFGLRAPLLLFLPVGLAAASLRT